MAAASGLAGTMAHVGTFAVEALHSGTRASSVAADGPFLFPRGGWGLGGSVSTVQWLFCTTHAYSEIESNGLPSTRVVALVRSLAKEPGSAAVEAQRPIAPQQARLKWLTSILLL